MVNKKIVIIVAILWIIVVGLILKLEINKFNQEFNNNTQTSSQISAQTENNTEQDNKQDEKQDSERDKEQDNKAPEKGSNEKKAIKLAQKEWGEDGTVYYYIEEVLSDTKYVVSVRSKSSTVGLIDYEVDIEKETVVEY